MVKGSVCNECAIKLKEHAQIVAERKAAADLEVYSVPPVAYALPYLKHDQAEKTGGADPIRSALFALVHAVSMPSARGGGSRTKLLIEGEAPSNYLRYEDRTCRRDVREALMTLFKATEEVLDRTYRRGKEEGSNLLGRLAQGDVSVLDFEERRAELSSER